VRIEKQKNIEKEKRETPKSFSQILLPRNALRSLALTVLGSTPLIGSLFL
jgi:hypothetical protein